MTDELDLLRRLGGDPAPPSEAAREHARSALEHAIERERGERRRPPVRGQRGTRRRPRWSVRIAAVGTAAVAAVVIGAALRSGSAGGPASANAATVLARLARVAASQPSLAPRHGQYLYTASHSLTESDSYGPGKRVCIAVFTQYRQNWIAADGHGLFRESDGPPRYRSAADAASCGSLPGGGGSPGTSNTWAARDCLTLDPVPLGHLPTDPARLRARLLTGKVEGGPPGPGEAFTQVGDLLRETDASPALRAALYRAAAGLRGVVSLGTVADHFGRRGLGLAITGHRIRHELIFAPRTGALLAEQDVAVAGGKVLDWTTYSAGRVVERLPARSPLPLRPACVRSAGTARQVPGRPQDTVLVGAPSLKLQSIPAPAPGTSG
jgi:hypothetical protein